MIEHSTTSETFATSVAEDPALAEALRKAEELRLAMESALGEAEKWQGACRWTLSGS